MTSCGHAAHDLRSTRLTTVPCNQGRLQGDGNALIGMAAAPSYDWCIVFCTVLTPPEVFICDTAHCQHRASSEKTPSELVYGGVAAFRASGPRTYSAGPSVRVRRARSAVGGVP